MRKMVWVWGALAAMLLAFTAQAQAVELPPQAMEHASAVALEHARVLGTIEGAPAVEASTVEAWMNQQGEKGPPPGVPVPPGFDPHRVVLRTVLHGRFAMTAGPFDQTITGTVLEYEIDPETNRVEGVSLTHPFATGAAVTAARRRRTTGHAAAWDIGNGECGDEYEVGYHHCFGRVDWSMSEAGEEVRGSEDQIDTGVMLIPNVTGSFVSNEHWVAFPNGWIEAGQWAQGGPGRNPEAIEWFSAEYTTAGGYHSGAEYGWPGWPVPTGYNAWERYLAVSAGNGEWEQRLNGNFMARFGGFPATSKYLVNGIEMATPWQPMSTMYEVTNYESMGGSWRNWNHAGQTVLKKVPGSCAYPWPNYTGGFYPGNYEFKVYYPSC